MFPQSPRAIEQQWMLLPGKAFTSPCTSPHLNTWILLRFFSQFWPVQEGNQAVERHSAILWRSWKNKNLEKWIIVRGISLFLATPAQSSNLKTNLEKRTKKNSIYLQRMRGKSSLALYRSFQSITKKKKEESNLRQFSERPPPQTMTLWRAAWLRESTRAQPSLPDASTYLCAFPQENIRHHTDPVRAATSLGALPTASWRSKEDQNRLRA